MIEGGGDASHGNVFVTSVSRDGVAFMALIVTGVNNERLVPCSVALPRLSQKIILLCPPLSELSIAGCSCVFSFVVPSAH